MGSDNRLQLDVPAGAVTAADVAAAGGKLSLSVRQIAPASGSLAGGSGLISFGMYLIQVVDAQGHLASHGLRAPITARLQYGTHDSALDLSHAFVVINGALPNTVTTAIAATSSSAAIASPNATRVTAKQIRLGIYSTQSATQDGAHHMLVLSSSGSGGTGTTPSSSLSWDTNSPIAEFGKPDPFSVDLSGGSLSAGFPIDVPSGPGGLTPPVTLSYSSAGVAEQHNPQGAAGWVGEGWNLSLGSISWTEKNYTPTAMPLGTRAPTPGRAPGS